jgi:hypothetical protein
VLLHKPEPITIEELQGIRASLIEVMGQGHQARECLVLMDVCVDTLNKSIMALLPGTEGVVRVALATNVVRPLEEYFTRVQASPDIGGLVERMNALADSVRQA